MLRCRSVTIATTPGTRGLDVTTPSRMASTAALKSAIILFPPGFEGISIRDGPPSRPARLTPCRARRLLHGETLIAGRGDFIAFLAIRADAAGVGQDPARLAFDVRAEVPRIGPGDEGRIGGLVVVRDPPVFRLLRGLDDCLVP